MTKDKIGIIDLGSNTFHLMIFSTDQNNNFTEIFKQRDFVALGEGGLGFINEKAFERGIHTLKSYMEILKNHNVHKIKAIGTAALRSASNGSEFIQTAKEKYSLDIELIKGDREAELIYKGVSLLLDQTTQPQLIMDIGGGSVEFILIQDGTMLWAESYNVGIAHLHNKFCKSDPISSDEIDAIYKFLDTQLLTLWDVLFNYKNTRLVGSSGSFEILENMAGIFHNEPKLSIINIKDFNNIYAKIIGSNLLEREKMDNLPKQRAKLVVPALVLMNYIIRKVNTQDIIVCPYALKEGIAIELLDLH